MHLHSYTDDDVRWCWRPEALPGPGAIDVELPTTPPPPLAARLQGDEDFWRAWTRLEVVAKLTDTPVLTLVGRGQLGLPAPEGIVVEHRVVDGAVVCVGYDEGPTARR